MGRGRESVVTKRNAGEKDGEREGISGMLERKVGREGGNQC